MHDYNGAEKDELSLKKGEKLEFLSTTADSGWAKGRLLLSGKTGLYPINFVQVILKYTVVDEQIVATLFLFRKKKNQKSFFKEFR